MDMLNHDSQVIVRVGLCITQNPASEGTHNGTIGISGNRDIQADEECFNNYGNRTNLQLLFGFGFCIPQNAHDTVC